MEDTLTCVSEPVVPEKWLTIAHLEVIGVLPDRLKDLFLARRTMVW